MWLPRPLVVVISATRKAEARKSRTKDSCEARYSSHFHLPSIGKSLATHISSYLGDWEMGNLILATAPLLWKRKRIDLGDQIILMITGIKGG